MNPLRLLTRLLLVFILVCTLVFILVFTLSSAFAHDLSADNATYVQGLEGAAAWPFMYLGAKHMFTGYDHLLFLFGVIFFLYRSRDILLYVTLFTIGHSLTLILGVWLGWRVNEHLVDAIIGLSVVYKAFENMGGFEKIFGVNPDTRTAVFVFGICHGLGLATKLQAYVSAEDGLLTNLLSFNLGVELGQLAALGLILIALLQWRRHESFQNQAMAANSLLMCAGFILAGQQFAGYVFS